jgi:O-antigen ligase
MERVYRWVAAFQMSKDRPWMGFGPGNFVNFYETYTVKSFQTYVSDNPEGSGVHCYYLMTLVEQGFIGMIIFIALSFLVLIQAEKIYHRCTDPARKRIIMAVTLCTVVMDAFLLINDMVETDKMGSFFFICHLERENMVAVFANICSRPNHIRTIRTSLFTLRHI